MVVRAAQMVVWERKSGGEVNLHSDRSRQFTSDTYQTLLGSHACVCSMSEVGYRGDNSACERLVRTMKRQDVGTNKLLLPHPNRVRGNNAAIWKPTEGLLVLGIKVSRNDGSAAEILLAYVVTRIRPTGPDITFRRVPRSLKRLARRLWMTAPRTDLAIGAHATGSELSRLITDAPPRGFRQPLLLSAPLDEVLIGFRL